ncbi:MAG: GNAT family N-acetyltransferase [Bacilli bacterium]|nr:GNAT family N-acetyltransferase [Bacilli bacterium]
MNTVYNVEIPNIQTKRLVLRPLILDDAEAMYKNWASDSRVTKYMTWDVHQNVEVTKEIIKIWMNEFNNSPNITFGIEYLENHNLIGTISFFKVDLSFKETEVGYCIAYDYWNKGIMTEALKAVLKFGFQTLGFEKINACHDSENPASGKVMMKAGMKYVSSSERIISKNIQLINYSLTKEEWLEDLGYEKVFIIMDNNKEQLELDTLVNYRPHQNTKVLTIKSNDYKLIEKDIEKIKKYYGDDIIGYDTLSLEKMIISELFKREWTISCAESCTGGMIISKLINVSGSSNVINESYVTYSEEAKMRILGVKNKTIKKYGVASLEVAEEMVEGVTKISNAEVGISVTGYAGTSGDNINDGVFYFAIKVKDYIYLEKHKVYGTRNDCRKAQTRYILWRLNTILKRGK